MSGAQPPGADEPRRPAGPRTVLARWELAFACLLIAAIAAVTAAPLGVSHRDVLIARADRAAP